MSMIFFLFANSFVSFLILMLNLLLFLILILYSQRRNVFFHCNQAVANASNVYPKDLEAPECGIDDMTRLAYLHEPGVLDNLRRRYEMNEIYVRMNFT